MRLFVHLATLSLFTSLPDEEILNHDDTVSSLEETTEDILIDAVRESMQTEGEETKSQQTFPDQVFIVPLNRRPFFPGMAAPIVIEPGAYYEVLKIVAKTEHKCMGLFLTKKEDVNIYKIGFDDLYQVGVVARILRIIPMEQGGAQVVSTWKRRVIDRKAGQSANICARRSNTTTIRRWKHLSKELKAYSISIITTIKELLKLNPLFKEELQIFLGHSDFTEPGKLADFAVALTTATREELQEVLETFDIARQDRQSAHASEKRARSQQAAKQHQSERSKRRFPKRSGNFSCASSSRRSKKSSGWKKTTRRSISKNSKSGLKSAKCPTM